MRAKGWSIAAAAASVLAIAATGCGSDDVDCGSYRFEEQSWVGEHPQSRRHEGLALARCRRLVGHTADQVTSLLGTPPVEVSSDHWVYYIPAAGTIEDAGALELFFRHARVVSMSAY